MVEAILTWRQHPTEIEDGLLDKGLDIMDWHRGTLSSRRFLVVIRHFLDTSAYRRALSVTGWSDAEEMAAEQHKMSAMLVAAKYAESDDPPEYVTFIPPNERLARFLEKANKDRVASKSVANFEREIGWSQ